MSWRMSLAAIAAGLAIAILSMRACSNWNRGAHPASSSPGIPAISSQEPPMAEPIEESDPRAGAVVERREVPSGPDAVPGGVDYGAAGSDAILIVRVRAKETQEPIAGVQLLLIPADVSGGWSPADIGGSRGTADEVLHTDADGLATFIVRADEARVLQTQGDEVPCESVGVDVPSLSAGERRELTVALATEADLHLYARVVAEDTGEPLPEV
jgi:hypothetical protein